MEAGRGMELSERQKAILDHVIEDYVAGGGQPVGSKALTERLEIRVSSSTVRYELAELEELGYLTHPHTSAGRVPTDRGYRFYVDGLLESQGSPTELPLDLSDARSEIDAALRATIDSLSQVTHLLALATAPPVETTVVRHVEVLQLQPRVVVVVLITSDGGVTKRVVVFDEAVDAGLVDWARAYLNEQVAGNKLSPRLLRNRFEDPGLSGSERRFLEAIRPAFSALVDSGEQSVYVGGAAGLMDEFHQEDIAAFRHLLETLERRAALLDLVRATLDSKRPFVRVGSEFEDPSLAKVALVVAPYGLTHRNLGTVSILGPTRMDYPKAIGAVRGAARELSRFVEELYDE